MNPHNHVRPGTQPPDALDALSVNPRHTSPRSHVRPSRDWSPASFQFVPTALGAFLVRGTVWRRGRDLSIGPYQYLGTWGIPEWLCQAGPGIRLSVVIELGGHRPSKAWLGLHALAHETRACAASLRAHAEELGEALNAMSFFEEVPLRGPSLPSTRFGLVHEHPLPSIPAPDLAHLKDMLNLFEGYEHPQFWEVELRGPNVDPSLSREALQLRRRLPPNPMHDDADLSALDGDLHRALLAAVSPELRFTLHGSLPGRLLRRSLERALGWTLGHPARLAEAEPDAFAGQGAQSFASHVLHAGCSVKYDPSYIPF